MKAYDHLPDNGGGKMAKSLPITNLERVDIGLIDKLMSLAIQIEKDKLVGLSMYDYLNNIKRQQLKTVLPASRFV